MQKKKTRTRGMLCGQDMKDDDDDEDCLSSCIL